MNHKLKNERIRRRLVSILSCIVVFCTTYALILPAVTLERDDIVYYCGKEEHQHTDECYESPKDRPLCGLKEGEMVDGHVHDESCYKTEMVLDCLEDHEHTDECYKEEKTLVCDKEEGAQEHKHSSKCFLSTEPLCGKEVHTHSRECESNKSLKETKEDWEHSIPAKLKDTAAERMVQIALSQKDYKEVKENFELNEEGHEQYYTRYGEWYGRPYEDWNVMFVSFVLRYAEIKNEQIPYGHDWNEWIEDLTKKQLFADEGYLPKDGDLIFIKDKEDENVPDKEIRNYAGIVTDIENRKIVVGDLNGQVKEITLDDKEYETNAYVAMIESDAKDDVPADKEENDDNETNEEERPDEETGKEEANEEETDPIEFRMPEQFEIENEDFTLKLTPRVFDEDVQEENQEQTEEDSEETNEEGLKIKKFSLNEENIQDKIDAENELTKEELEQIAQANEEQKKEEEDKPLLTVQLEKIDEQAQTSEEEQAEIEQLKEQSLENVDQDNLLDLSFYKLRFFAKDQEVDLKDQKFDAELTPTQKFVDGCDIKDEFPDAAPEAEVGYYLQVVQPGTQVPIDLVTKTENTKDQSNEEDEEVSTISNNALLISDNYNNESMIMTLDADEPLGTITNKTPNPNFFVQIYSYLYEPVLADESDYKTITQNGDAGIKEIRERTLEVIDMTSSIPNAYENAQFKDYKKNPDGSIKKELSSEPKLLYTTTQYTYHQAPNVKYFNKLDSSASYTPTAYWILKSNQSKDSTNPNDWIIVNEHLSDIHFTNNPEHPRRLDQENPNDPDHNYIYIGENTVIRLVYTAVSGNDDVRDTTFYDYDFFTEDYNLQMNGKVYGINNPDNYGSGNTSKKFVFGNNGVANAINQSTNVTILNGIYTRQINGNNPANGNPTNNNKTSVTTTHIYKQDDGSEKTYEYRRSIGAAPVFNIVTGRSNGNLQFNTNISAPENLFNPSVGSGIHGPYAGKLHFSKTGDSYSLYSVSGETVTDNIQNRRLDQFTTRDAYSGGALNANHFWPLDGREGAILYGLDENLQLKNGDIAGPKLNTSDFKDTGEHNTAFGMKYELKFNIPENYKGPLRYFFFGDDDMWVFVDDVLICDLGGVHVALGAEVDIREIYKKKTGKDISEGEHTFSVYYLERGQSGSTCYMEYTLPSIVGIPPEQETGQIKFSKETTDENRDKTYYFDITITDPEHQQDVALNDYAYTVYKLKNPNSEIKEYEVDPNQSDVIISGKGTIGLKKDEYVIIKYLPIGATYTITEQVPSTTNVYIKNNSDEFIKKSSISGTIQTHTTDSIGIIFKNELYYQLPETGSLGIDPPLIAGSAGVMTTSFYALTLKRKGRWKKRKR